MKIGIYPGTFDPITHGHTDIITRSLRVFDKVMVAVAPNPTKHPLFNLAERLEMVQLVLKDIGQVESSPLMGCWWTMCSDPAPMPSFAGCGRSRILSMNFKWLSSTANWPNKLKRYS